MRRFLAVGVTLLVLILGLVLGAVAVASRLLGEGPTAPAVVGAGGLLVVAAVALVTAGGFIARRFAAPLDDVMEAAERVRHGDTGVRVAPRGPRDVRRLATTFNEMTGRLESNEQRRRALLADLAHELRTPLSVIRGNVEAIADGVYQPDPQRLELISDEVAVMERLLDDLATLSTAEAGALRLHKDDMAVSDLVAGAVRAVSQQATSAGVTISTDGDSGCVVHGDPVRLEQVLVNLLTNAIRHTPTGGQVEVAVRHDAGEAVITVSDTGTGIAPEDLPHIFDRFVRSADSGGSGLGLAIARRLVESHDGTIAAGAGPGGGTVVTIRLPS